MIEGFSLGSYLQLVDYTARWYRAGKASLSREVATILDRLGSSIDHWQARLDKLRQGRLPGRFFASSRQRLRDIAERLGLTRVPNLGGTRRPELAASRRSLVASESLGAAVTLRVFIPEERPQCGSTLRAI
jgi:hypothetical protein